MEFSELDYYKYDYRDTENVLVNSEEYYTDEGYFKFDEIKEEFLKYKTENILTIENIKNRDFGLSF